MPNCNLDRQVQDIIGPRMRLGHPKPDSRDSRVGLFYSVRTAKAYGQHLHQIAVWAKATYECRLDQLTPVRANKYLAERAAKVTYKTLNQDRLALQLLPQIRRDDLVQPHSEIPSGPKTTEPKTYTDKQVQIIRKRQTPTYAFVTELAQAYGFRAHELLTLRHLQHLDPTDPVDHAILDKLNRHEWYPDRFHGKPSGESYVVVGKGGLPRIAPLSHEHATRLEVLRLAVPRDVADRGVNYQQHYDLPGGHRWSNSFGRASQRALGKEQSYGADALRHGYAMDRMDHHLGRGLPYSTAEELLAQELGHLRERSTRTYLRGERAS